MKITLISTNGGVNVNTTLSENEKAQDVLRQLILYCGRVASKCY